MPVRLIFPSSEETLPASRISIPSLPVVPFPLVPFRVIFPVPVASTTPLFLSEMPSLNCPVTAPTVPVRLIFPFTVETLEPASLICIPRLSFLPELPVPLSVIFPVPVDSTTPPLATLMPGLLLPPVLPVPVIEISPVPELMVAPSRSTLPTATPPKVPCSIVTSPPLVQIWLPEFITNWAVPVSRSPALAFSSFIPALKLPPLRLIVPFGLNIMDRPACKVSPLPKVIGVTLSSTLMSLFACNVTLAVLIAAERSSPLMVELPVGLSLNKLFPATGLERRA